MGKSSMSIYDADIHCWSGLFSANNESKGLRHVCREISDAQFHSSNSGFEGWEEVASAAIKRQAKSLLLIGHSNGNYATTKIAERLKQHYIDCWLICFDRTLKSCPKLGSNVIEAIDIWAGLAVLVPGEDFNGTLALHSFQKETHSGVLNNKQAQQIAIDFGIRWKTEQLSEAAA
jgi:hypothetical protein